MSTLTDDRYAYPTPEKLKPEKKKRPSIHPWRYGSILGVKT
jgi:hypothetical protein